MNNISISNILDEVADLLELTSEENPFRIRAYRNAARIVRSYPEQLLEIVKDPNRKLRELPGIGEDLEKKILSIISTGKLSVLDKLREKVPSGVRDLLRVPGLGPKKVMFLHKELGLQSINDLQSAIVDHRVEKLKGFGKKTVDKISSGIELVKKSTDRILLSEAKVIAEALTGYFRNDKNIKRFEVAGSYRRRKDTVGDLDLLVICDDPDYGMNKLEKFPGVKSIQARGPKQMTVRLNDGFQIDLRIVNELSWGASLVYFTGSKAHNIELRKRALDRGLKINEYGVFRENTLIGGATEQEVYSSIGLAWIPPEMREMRQEFTLSEANNIPALVTIEDIKGDLHTHTRFTDGRDSIHAMATAALKLGYAYLAFTDHSRRVSMAKGLDAKGLEKVWSDIDEIQLSLKPIKLLKGVELDILEDGRLDLPNRVLANADWVIAAIHYGLNQSKKKMTRRLINAIKNPYVSAIAHPTGRLIGERSGYEVDYEEVFKAAADYDCALEINGQPQRLDLSGELLERASQYPISFVINSDAHAAWELGNIQYALDQARRAGLSAKRIINTRPWPQFPNKSLTSSSVVWLKS